METELFACERRTAFFVIIVVRTSMYCDFTALSELKTRKGEEIQNDILYNNNVFLDKLQPYKV